MLRQMKKRVQVLGIALGVTITSIGCGFQTKEENSSNKKYILEGTLLEHAVLAKVNGDIGIVSRQASGQASEKDDHIHYHDILNGDKMTNVSGDVCIREPYIKNQSIEEIGRIDSYLTQEELMQAYYNTLTIEDIISILYRIKQDLQEEQKQFIKK